MKKITAFLMTQLARCFPHGCSGSGSARRWQRTLCSLVNSMCVLCSGSPRNPPESCTPVNTQAQNDCPSFFFFSLSSLNLQVFHTFLEKDDENHQLNSLCTDLKDNMKMCLWWFRQSTSSTSRNQCGFTVYITLSWLYPRWKKAQYTQLVHQRGSIIS